MKSSLHSDSQFSSKQAEPAARVQRRADANASSGVWQRRSHESPRQAAQRNQIAQLAGGAGEPLPASLQTGMESLSGIDMSAVRVHHNSPQPAQMHAHAFAQGNQIHLGPGQEKHLPHEAWHVVQQAQGRVSATRQLHAGTPINDDPSLEREADSMGARAQAAGSQETAIVTPALAGTAPSLSAAPRQGKWFRMSTIFDDDDELAIKRIADEAEAGNYIEAFWLMVTESERYAALAQDMEKALHLASIFDVMDMVQGVLRETYDPKNLKAFTIAEVIGHIEGNLEVLMAQHPELAESVAVEQASPAEIGLAAGEEIRELIQSGKVKDESELASQFDRLAYEYGMQYIHIDDTRLPHVLKYRINPSFEIQLSGSNAVEMRSEGTGSGSNKTRVQWNPTKLNLTTTTNPSTNSYTVGSHMRAFPLSQDHAAGSVAGADTDHVGMMTNLPSASNRAMSGSGSGPYYYIRGHLLNDNLGGIANEVNLFPITHEANGQHKSFVEQYIKNGIAQGYVYRYEVAITNVKVGDEPSHGGYYVDSDLEFSFARLDSAQKDVTGTAHTGKIQSRYKTTGADPFDKSTEYATDYGGSYNHPVTVGSEEIHKPGEVAPVSSNAGLTGHVSTFTVTAPLGSNILGGASQSIDSNASLVPTGQLLSLNKSTKSKVVTYFDKLVKGWNTTSVDSWITDVRANSYTKWDDVFNSATTSFGLDAAVATKVRQGYLTRVSINGKANGT